MTQCAQFFVALWDMCYGNGLLLGPLQDNFVFMGFVARVPCLCGRQSSFSGNFCAGSVFMFRRRKQELAHVSS